MESSITSFGAAPPEAAALPQVPVRAAAGPGLRVALLSPSGWGNLGDAAILDSLVHGLRSRVPGAHVVGVTLNPRDTRRRHGIAADTFSASRVRTTPSSRTSRTSPIRPPANPTTARSLPPDARAGAAGRQPSRARAASTGGCATCRARSAIDAAHVSASGTRTCSWSRAGGRSTTSGAARGHPYALARWARLARRLRARYVVLSVGTGTLGSRLSCRFLAQALRGAAYVSFRDEGSRRLAARVGAPPDAPVVPDLAFAVPLPAARETKRNPLAVGISPMVYLASRAWPEQDQARYLRYLDALAAVARGQLDAGRVVVLFGTDGQDEQALDDLQVLLLADLPAPLKAQVERPRVSGVPELLELLAGLDAVVASRLHGVILTHVAGRPCLALSYERKVRQHMRDFDEEQACLEIEGLDPAVAGRALAHLLESRDAVRARISARASRRRAEVDAQYDAVFGRGRT